MNLFSYNEAKASCEAKVDQLKNLKRTKQNFADLSAAEKLNQANQDPQTRLFPEDESKSTKVAIGHSRDKNHARIQSSAAVFNKNSQTQHKIN